jgi:hypothetical protein
MSHYLLFACWQGKFSRQESSEIWKSIPLCLMWIIWRERNKWTFEGIELNLVFEWRNAYAGSSPLLV